MSQLSAEEQNIMKQVLGDEWEAVRKEVPKQAGLNENLARVLCTFQTPYTLRIAIFRLTTSFALVI